MPDKSNRKARGKWKDGLQKRGDAWYCRYVDTDGKQKVKATGQPTMELARKYLAEVRARVARGLAGITEVTKEDRQRHAVTVKELLVRFLAEYNRPKIKDIKRWRDNARCCINRIVARPIGGKPVVDLRPVDGAELRDSLQEQGYLASATNETLKVLGAAITWAMDRDLLPPMRNPMASVERMTPTPLEERYSLDEVHKLLQGAPDGMLLVLIAFSLYTGCRPGEARGLRWPDVHLDAPIPYVEIRYSYDTTPKTAGSRRLVPIHRELMPYLRAWQGPCPKTPADLLFPAPRKTQGTKIIAGYRLARTGDDFGLTALLLALGCHVPKERQSGILKDPRERIWHTFRHTLISALAESGASGDAISRIVGHSGQGSGAAAMTLNYSHVGLDYLARELGKVSFTPPAVAGVVRLQDAAKLRAV